MEIEERLQIRLVALVQRPYIEREDAHHEEKYNDEHAGDGGGEIPAQLTPEQHPYIVCRTLPVGGLVHGSAPLPGRQQAEGIVYIILL